MGRRLVITETERKMIKRLYTETKDDEKRSCHSGNVKKLDEILGDPEDSEDYIQGVKLRKAGVHSLTDKLELLKTLRIHPKITDGGEHLSHSLMTTLNQFKPYNYFDETRQECNRVMDKIIELYKENRHGEELVKDIEKVYDMEHISPRAKEFLKHCLNIIKGNL